MVLLLEDKDDVVNLIVCCEYDSIDDGAMAVAVDGEDDASSWQHITTSSGVDFCYLYDEECKKHEYEFGTIQSQANVTIRVKRSYCMPHTA